MSSDSYEHPNVSGVPSLPSVPLVHQGPGEESVRENARSFLIENSPPPYRYKHGRQFDFQILVGGEDYDFVVPAALMCVSSGHFSDLSRSAGMETRLRCMQVNVTSFNRETIATVLGGFIASQCMRVDWLIDFF